MITKDVTPECIYRGSSPNISWIPAKGMREYRLGSWSSCVYSLTPLLTPVFTSHIADSTLRRNRSFPAR